VRTATVDGVPAAADAIRVVDDGRTHEIAVELGAGVTEQRTKNEELRT